ncbi:P-loop NTPase family protein [Desulfonatronum parangueonense]
METQPVFISTLTEKRKHLLLVSDDESNFSRLSAMIIQSSQPIGLLGDEYPLLLNLTALENIALGCMYRNQMSLDDCHAKIQPLADRLKLTGSLNQRSQFLSRAQLLKVQLLRCIANESTFVFLSSASRSDCDILDRAAANLDIDVFLWVAILSNNLDAYNSLEYGVIDLNTLQ